VKNWHYRKRLFVLFDKYSTKLHVMARMEPRRRNFLFAGILILFAVMAPLALLYARGFSIDPDEGKVIQTGMILIDTNVARVNVSLDHQPATSEDDPVILRGLTAGTYHVRLEREGLRPWEADLTVAAEQVTRVDNVVLTYEEPELSSPVTESLGLAEVSPNSRYIAFLITEGKDAGVWLHTSGEEDNRKIISTDDDFDLASIDELRWSDNSRTLLIHNSKDGFGLISPHVASPQVRTLSFIKKMAATDVQLDDDEPSIVYYRDDKNRLFRWRTARQESSPELLASDVLEFAVANPKVFFLQKDEQDLQILSVDLRQTAEQPTEIASIKDQSEGQLFVSVGKHIAVLTNDQKLWLLAKNGDVLEFTELASDVDRALWSPDSDFLFYQKNGELWVHDQDPQRNENAEVMLTRLASLPNEIRWHPDSRHLVLIEETDSALTAAFLHVSRTAPLLNTVATFSVAPLELQIARKGSDFIYLSGDKRKLEILTVAPDPGE
jgi:hypothetical protein